MATEIGRRLAALESKVGIGRGAVDVIIRTIVRPSPEGAVDAPLKGLQSLCGWRVEREEGESRDAFIRRATMLARRSGGIAVLREVL